MQCCSHIVLVLCSHLPNFPKFCESSRYKTVGFKICPHLPTAPVCVYLRGRALAREHERRLGGRLKKEGVDKYILLDIWDRRMYDAHRYVDADPD